MICLMFKFGFSLEQVWNSFRNKNGSFINFTHNEKKIFSNCVWFWLLKAMKINKNKKMEIFYASSLILTRY